MDDGYTMVQSVTNALSETAGDYLGDITEIWVDSKLPDNIFKEIPIIKTLAFGNTVIKAIKECHEIRQVSQFLLATNTVGLEETISMTLRALNDIRFYCPLQMGREH